MTILKEYHFNAQRSNQALKEIYSTVVLRDILLRNTNVDQIILEMFFLMKATYLLQKINILLEKQLISIFLCYVIHLFFIPLVDMM